MIQKIQLKTYLIIPLIIQNEVIGLAYFTSHNSNFQLSKEEIRKIEGFCNQISGALHNAQLLVITEEARQQANKEKEKALVAQKETSFLNEFSKVINSSDLLEDVFNYAVMELYSRLDADIYLLQIVDEKRNELFTRCFFGEIPFEQSQWFLNIKFPISPEVGSVFRTVSKKKTFYLSSIERIPESKLSEFDLKIQSILQPNSILQIPLVVQYSVIGIMHINKLGGMKKLSKDEIRFAEALCEQLAIAVNNKYLQEQAEKERQKSEKLLLNILPKEVAEELKEKGAAEPVLFENVSVMFTDFKGFTQIAEKLTPGDLVKDLDACFTQFDKISEYYNLEKLKTIGDSYMCAGGIPRKNTTHAIDCVLAALEIQDFMNMMKSIKEGMGFPYWELRLGIHSGSLVAGVIGEKKFAYDVWGDTVNTASRMESSGTPGKINISGVTYELVKEFFECEFRGMVKAKNKGDVAMYYVNALKEEYSMDENHRVPNEKFWERYNS